MLSDFTSTDRAYIDSSLMSNIANEMGKTVPPPYRAQLNFHYKDLKIVKVDRLELSSINSSSLQELSPTNMNEILKEFFRIPKIFPSKLKKNTIFLTFLQFLIHLVFCFSNSQLRWTNQNERICFPARYARVPVRKDFPPEMDYPRITILPDSVLQD